MAHHSHWARQIARSVYCRIHGFGGIWEDCAQNALVGLLESIDRFDPERGIEFQLYARYRVRGSVFNGLRALLRGDGRRPENENSAAVVRERLESFGEGEAVDPLEAFVNTAVSLGLGYLLEAQSMPASSALDAYIVAEKAQQDSLVSECVRSLPEREQLVVVLHYYHHLPFVQVAERMKVTKGRVSQLHKQALDRLRHIFRDRWSELA